MNWRHRHSESESLSDLDIMARVKEGDTELYAELVHRHQQSLLNFFARLGVYIDREDLVQETFVRIYKHRNRYEPRAKFTTFMYTVARNVWRDSIRKNTRYKEVLKDFGDKAPQTQKAHDRRVGAACDASDLVAKLPKKLRLVVVMSIFQGLKYAEIAEILGIPVGTVKSRMHLAMQAMRKQVDG